jgi:NAD(P)-dependent dehydrogenase (short-subunit alcohol dehydrogenase family)
MRSRIGKLFGAIGALLIARTALRRWSESRYELRGRVVLITGGSRGLGLLLAREYARLGARLVLVARDGDALERACQELRASGNEALGIRCDVTDRAQVRNMLEQALQHFGRLDILVNDAGRIEVGPLPSMTLDDFSSAMNTNFWGAVFVVHEALQHLKPGEGRIVNISSIGGLVSVPHLLPYSSSKFALTGFSLGLNMELRKRGIRVTTVCPGLMRTGSPINASFKGDASAEYAWFSVADSIPLLSMHGGRAARAIVRASRRGAPLLILGMPAKLAALANGLFPSLVVRASELVARALPQSSDTAAQSGRSIADQPPRWLTALGTRAAAENNELG